MSFVQLKVGNSLSNADLDQQLKVQHTRNVVGSFYEALAAHIFNAERWRGEEIYVSEKDRNKPYEGIHPNRLIPDLVRRENSTYIEVKGGNKNSQFKVYKWQAELYDELRRRATVPIYRPRVEYAIFMHGLKGMTKKLGTPRRLIGALAENTICCVVLDLDIILRFQSWMGTVEYGDPNGVDSRQYYPQFYPITSKHLRKLQENPRKHLRAMGLKARNFTVERKMVGEGMKVNGSFVEPFMMLTLRRKRRQRKAYTGFVDESWFTRAKQKEFFSREKDVLDQLANEDEWDESFF